MNKPLPKISVCGVYCEKCPKYIKKHCSGCGPNPVCTIPQCAQKKKVKFCFDCKVFPCKLHYRRAKMYAEWLDFLKSDEIVG